MNIVAFQYLLFNLRDDLGEKTNLAVQKPELVAELDARIEEFLAETDAVVPIPNPDFDPAQYRAEDEGKQTPKAQAKTKSPPARAAKSDDSDPALQGWKMRNGTATVKDGIVTARGRGEPFLGVGAGISGPAQVTFRVRSAVGGAGKAEWIPSGGKSQSVPFEIPAGDWQTIRLDIPATGPLVIFRLHLPAQTHPSNSITSNCPVLASRGAGIFNGGPREVSCSVRRVASDDGQNCLSWW